SRTRGRARSALTRRARPLRPGMLHPPAEERSEEHAPASADCSPDAGSRRPRQPVAEGVHHEPHPIPHPELLEDVREVGLDGALADAERDPDFLVLVAGGDQAHYLELALGETVLVARRGGAGSRPEVRDLLDQSAGHTRVHPYLARADALDRLHERLARRVLQDD